MNRDATRKWLQLIGCKISATTGRTGWVLSDCPLGPWRHKEGKSASDVFGVRLDPGDAFCYCFACDFHGSQSELLIEMKRLNKQAFHQDYPFGEALSQVMEAEEAVELNLDFPDIEEMLLTKKEGLHEFPQWWLETFSLASSHEWATSYLQSRQVPGALWGALDLRADTEQRRICFPVRDFKGVLRGLHGRAVDPVTEPRYRMYLHAKRKNVDVWLGESWVDFTKPLVVVEGPFDLASVYRVYRNVASPMYSNPSEPKLRRMMDVGEWVTLLDVGTGGDKGRSKIDKVCKGCVVHHLTPTAGKKDPGQMSVQELQDVLGPYVPLDIAIV